MLAPRQEVVFLLILLRLNVFYMTGLKKLYILKIISMKKGLFSEDEKICAPVLYLRSMSYGCFLPVLNDGTPFELMYRQGKTAPARDGFRSGGPTKNEEEGLI